MNPLWQASPRSVRDVMNALPTGPAYTTIATMMQNLKTKNMVHAQRDGRFVHYVPLMSCEEYVARQMHQALDSSPDKATAILHFVRELPEEGLQMLREALDQS